MSYGFWMMGGAMGADHPPVSPYLDDLAVPPHVALSLKKLVSTATKSIRVRRTNDNAETDIGFSGDVLDTASLLGFVGASSAHITTVYDQTGNGWDATQATSAKQPRIVNSGIYDGKIVLDGTSNALTIPSLVMGTPYAGVYGTAKLVYGSNYKILFEHGSDSSTVEGAFGLYMELSTANLTQAMSNGGSNRRRVKIYVQSWAVLEQFTALFDRSIIGSDELLLYRGGVAQSGTQPATFEQTGNFTTQHFHIGARNGTSLYADAWLETLVVYNADTSAIRESIEAIVG